MFKRALLLPALLSLALPCFAVPGPEDIEQAFAPASLAPNESPIKLTLQQIMQISNVTQLSIAVIDDDRIDWAKGYGVTDAGAPITTHTLFPACSISKPIAALAALRLVEEGRLTLDGDVNDQLKSWKVPENEFTAKEKVTVRRILTHTAGTLVHGLPGYEPGQAVPTLLQALNGEKPATNDPVRVAYVPGTKQSYSGGGFLILQQLIADVTGESFPKLVAENVFKPLHLKDSTYEPMTGDVATGRDRNGERVPTRTGPEFAAGGLWTTPSDLARIVIDVALSRHGRSHRVLSTAMTQEMLRVQVNPAIATIGGPVGGLETRTGLGWFVGLESDHARFEHSGVNIGFSANVLMWDSGHGVIVMANNWSFEAEVLMRYIVNAVAKEYRWSYRAPTFTRWPYADTIVLAAAKLRGADTAIARYRQLKQQWIEQQKRVGDLGIVWASEPPDYAPNEWDLWSVAHAIADQKHVRDAIKLMKVDIVEYPEWAPGSEYLGSLYEKAGETQHAVETFERLLKIEPGNTAASRALERLRLHNRH